MSDYLILAPVFGLLFLGSIIALRSGAVGMDVTGNARVIAGNFSALLVRVVVFLIAMGVLGYVLNTPSLLHLAGR